MRALHASRGYRIFRRAGRQDGWSTLVLGVTSSKGQREYVVAMTGHGKNGALADVARTLAGLMKAEDL